MYQLQCHCSQTFTHLWKACMKKYSRERVGRESTATLLFPCGYGRKVTMNTCLLSCPLWKASHQVAISGTSCFMVKWNGAKPCPASSNRHWESTHLRPHLTQTQCGQSGNKHQTYSQRLSEIMLEIRNNFLFKMWLTKFITTVFLL